MATRRYEQRNPYRGNPPRPGVCIALRRADGSTEEVELLADTGSPCAIVVSQTVMAGLSYRAAPDVNSNFGLLEGGWLRLVMPELGLDIDVIGFASDAIANAAAKSDPRLVGLAGLPFLRLVEYGGDADYFWLRPMANHP